MGKILLVDGNSIGYAEQQATKLRSGDLETQAIFGFMQKMRSLQVGYPGATIIVLWDGRAQHRYDLYPEYKGNRDSDPVKIEMRKRYAEAKPYIFRLLACLGIRQYTAFKHEADDMAGYLCGKYVSQGYEVGLITGDQDWLQLMRPGVFWRDVREDSRYVTMANFFEYTGYKTPAAFLQGKCLTGDTSDTINGVGGLGATYATELLAEFGSVRNFWDQCDSGQFVPKYARHKRLQCREAREIFARNLKLMQLIHVPKPEKEDVKFIKGSFNQDLLIELCEELVFKSILNSMDSYTKPFKEQQ